MDDDDEDPVVLHLGVPIGVTLGGGVELRTLHACEYLCRARGISRDDRDTTDPAAVTCETCKTIMAEKPQLLNYARAETRRREEAAAAERTRREAFLARMAAGKRAAARRRRDDARAATLAARKTASMGRR